MKFNLFNIKNFKLNETFVINDNHCQLIKKTIGFYTTKELQIPTVNTKSSQRLKPEKTILLFSAQPFGVANTTGTPTTKAKDTAINANKAI